MIRLSRKSLGWLNIRKQSLSGIRIGDVVVEEFQGSAPNLIPPQSFDHLPNELVVHMRWMAQKYNMGQDMFICGHPGQLRRKLVMEFAAVAGLEVEYIAISRDTTENDLKQRREIQGSSVVFHDQPPVRAAVNGRLLVLDGIEYAERNVLPTLNNLLENREMALEDGRFLTKESTIQAIKGSNSLLTAVHPRFRVVALGQCVPPYSGRTMDPPLRSRFQSRFVDELSSESLLELYSASLPGVEKSKLQQLIGFYEALRIIRSSIINEGGTGTMTGLPVFSIDSVEYCLRLLQLFPNLSTFDAVERCVPAISWMNSSIPARLRTSVTSAVDKLGVNRYKSHDTPEYNVVKISSGSIGEKGADCPLVSFACTKSPSEQVDVPVPGYKPTNNTLDNLLPEQQKALSNMLVDHACGKHLCLLGPKGSGKSYVARNFGSLLGYKLRTFPLYQELTARDFLQRRVTVASESRASDNSADAVPLPPLADHHHNSTELDTGTSWVDSPLIAAARAGDVCVLDGIDRVDPQVLYTLRGLLQDGVIDLPNGERLSRNANSIHPSFRIIALGLPPNKTRPEDARDRWISSDLGFASLNLSGSTSADIMRWTNNSQSALNLDDALPEPSLLEKAASKIAGIVGGQSLQTKVSKLESVVNSLDIASQEQPELRLSLRQVLRLQRLTGGSINSNADLADTLERMLLVSFMPNQFVSKFYEALGVSKVESDAMRAKSRNIAVEETENTLRIGEVSYPKRTGPHPEKIPHPLYYDNISHTKLLKEMLHALSVGEQSLLLIGNQGVGKNKLADRLLELLNAEREYIQLHRDTTIQSLTLLPTLENGQIRYEDSPMVRAAREGRVLVVDEADKAPLEVVCLLKSLAEDGEVILYDGRRLLSHQRYVSEGGDLNRVPSDVVLIHPDFRLLVLANRPGFPFLGNNFFRECGDVFSTHIVENLDVNSEIELLQQYGPNVERSVLTRLAGAFGALREAHSSGDLSYPFSAREAVAVVKHISAFPGDGVAAAVEDILGFDSLTPLLRAQIAQVFQNHGLPVPLRPIGFIQSKPPVNLAAPWELPKGVQSTFSMDKSSRKTLTLSSKAMTAREWTSVNSSKSNYSLSTSRLLSFSEELCRLSLTGVVVDGQDSSISYLGRVVSMISDDSSLHVLTVDPLVLHTFENVAEAVDIFRGKVPTSSSSTQYYHRRELLSEEMSWRLGGSTFKPILTHQGGKRGGCTIILPELSIALSVPRNMEEKIDMLTLPLKGDRHGNKKSSMSIFLDSSKSSSTLPSDGTFVGVSSGDDDGVTVLYRKGGSSLFLLDFDSNVSFQADLTNAFVNGIQNVISLKGGDWLISGGNCGQVMKFSKSGSIILEELNRDSNLEFSASHYSMSRDNVSFLSGDNKTLARNFVSTNEPTKSPSFVNWPRVRKSTAPLSVVASGSLGGVVANVIMEEKMDKSKSFTSDPSLHLEVVSPLENRGITLDLGRPNAAIDAHVTIRGVGMLKNQQLSSASSEIGQPLTADTLIGVCHADGVIRIFETDPASLKWSQNAWENLFGKELETKNWGVSKVNARGEDQAGKPRTGLGAPKHGKEDPKNEPHVGGNTWAGGTGGSDTAGLGGRGGPYRLDKGHTVHQVSDELKAEVSEKSRQEAAKIAKEGLRRRLEEIKMGKSDYEVYMRYKKNVDTQISQLRTIMEELSRRSRERVWLRHQTHGDLDDSKLVDGLTGDRLVFKRRGLPDNPQGISSESSSTHAHKKRLQFVVDVSGSMYRFNGQDRRLERMLEAVLLVMESMPSAMAAAGSTVDYCITGHSGDSPDLHFLDFECEKPSNEADRFAVLESMVAHTQYTMAGDNTLKAISTAVNNIIEGTDGDEHTDRFVFVVSDANFERYGISPKQISALMTKDKRVQVHLILIASLGDEAAKLSKQLPAGRVHMCFETTSMPSIFRSILTSYGGALDV